MEISLVLTRDLAERADSLAKEWGDLVDFEHAAAVAAFNRALTQLDTALDGFDRSIDYFPRAVNEDGGIEPLLRVWRDLCVLMDCLSSGLNRIERLPRRSFQVETIRQLRPRINRLASALRVMAISLPQLDLAVPPNLASAVWTVRIPPLAYLRSMLNLFWSAIRHPLSETTIDLSTGRVLYRT